MKALNKTQLETVTKTLSDRLSEHLKRKSDAMASAVKPSAEAKKLSQDFKNCVAKIKQFNQRESEKNELHYEISDTWSYPGELKITGYTHINLPGDQWRNTSIVPEMKDEAIEKSDAVKKYILALALGTATVEDMDEFMNGLLK